MNTIECRNLVVKRGGFTLGPINLNIEKGEIFCILGRTGSGKTVFLETLAGFYDKKYKGEIVIHGKNKGFVYQDSGLFPHMTVEQNISYGLRMNRVDKNIIEEKIQDITKILSISNIRKQYPATVSGGERQRTAIARTLVMNPDIIFMDEPFSALDPITRKKMYEEIKRIHQKFKCTMIFVTHDFREAQHLADRIGIMLNGKLRTVVKSEELFIIKHDEDVQEFLGGVQHE